MVMDEIKKQAYRNLLYHVLLDIRSICWNTSSAFESRKKIELLADWVHNLAAFSAKDFEGFDEEKFWNRHHPELDVKNYVYAVNTQINVEMKNMLEFSHPNKRGGPFIDTNKRNAMTFSQMKEELDMHISSVEKTADGCTYWIKDKGEICYGICFKQAQNNVTDGQVESILFALKIVGEDLDHSDIVGLENL
jgi:hypothetical protein